MKEETKKILKQHKNSQIQHKNVVDISRKTYEGNGIETIPDSEGILWLNKMWLNQNKLGVTAVKNTSRLDLNPETNQNAAQHNFYTQRISN